MPLIIGTGSNLGDRASHLQKAKERLMGHFTFTAESRVYSSPPVGVGYENGPLFYNQVLEFQTPSGITWGVAKIMDKLLEIEREMGRKREASDPYGPRGIDLDLLFLDRQIWKTPHVTIPHPRLFERSFVVKPLRELPSFGVLKKHFDFPQTFNNVATPIFS